MKSKSAHETHLSHSRIFKTLGSQRSVRIARNANAYMRGERKSNCPRSQSSTPESLSIDLSLLRARLVAIFMAAGLVFRSEAASPLVKPYTAVSMRASNSRSGSSAAMSSNNGSAGSYDGGGSMAANVLAAVRALRCFLNSSIQRLVAVLNTYARTLIGLPQIWQSFRLRTKASCIKSSAFAGSLVSLRQWARSAGRIGSISRSKKWFLNRLSACVHSALSSPQLFFMAAMLPFAPFKRCVG